MNEQRVFDNIPFIEAKNDETGRIDDFEFNSDVENLEEDVVYDGQISECFGVKKDNGDMLIIVAIALDSDGKHEFTSLYKYSPLQNLIRELERDLQRPAKPADLLGIYVEFTVKYNGGYCNLKAIKRIVA